MIGKHGPAIFGSAIAALLLAACGSGSDKPKASRQAHGHIHVLTLAGTPYQMGRQHGELMTEEIQALADFSETDPAYSIIFQLAETGGYTEAAMAGAYQDVYDECQGMVDAVTERGVTNWPLSKCLMGAYLLVVLENLGALAGCSQVVAAHDATPDGELVHARNLDWGQVQFLLDHPTLTIRHPRGGIPWVQVGFPGEVFSLSGINAEGVFVAINECYAESDRKQAGRSHTQMARQILHGASSLDEAEAFLRDQEHASAETLIISDGKVRDAAAFEMSASHLAVRRLSEDGLLFHTNHFAHPDMEPLHAERLPDHDTRTRWQRLEQLLPPDAPESLHGQLDAPTAISILRDRLNPYTGEEHPPELISGGGSIANNGAIHSMIALPERGALYVALGQVPVPSKPFVGFDLEALFAGEIEAPDPDTYE